jgi:hypothetical protein
VDQFPVPSTVYTDGSVVIAGGAAAFDADSESFCVVSIPAPCSSTHCELVVLCLALTFSPPPAAVLTDPFGILTACSSLGYLAHCSSSAVY